MFTFKVNQLIKPKGAEPLPKRTDLTPQGSVKEENHSIHDVNLVNDITDTNEQRENSDSVRRYSRDENGQPQLVIINDVHNDGNVDKRDTTPLTEPRTKGEPVVWQYEDADEFENVNGFAKSEVCEANEEDDDVKVEICIPDVSDDHVHSIVKESEVNAEEHGYELLEEEEEEEEKEEKEKKKMEVNEEAKNEEAEIPDEQHFDEEDVFPIEVKSLEMSQERQPVPRKERNVSVVSDIEMDELEQALDEAQGIPQTSPEGAENQEKRPFIGPLEYEESDFESDSEEQDPLSTIQEEEEEDLSESVAFPSDFLRSRSASEGFQSDDDVMDLVDEDHDCDELAAHGVDIETVRKISQTQRTAALSPENEKSGELGLGGYLAIGNEDVKADVSYNWQHKLFDGIELEESESGGVELDGIETTYSDTEADHHTTEQLRNPKFHNGVSQRRM